MTEERFTTWGTRIKRDGKLLNIEFKTRMDSKLCCKLLNQMDKEKLEYLEKVDELNKWHEEHYGCTILQERLKG